MMPVCRVGLILLLLTAASCGDDGAVEQSAGSGTEPNHPCFHDQAATVLDVAYVITDEAEITKHEALSARYLSMPGVRAVVASPAGGTYVIVDDEADESVIQEAEADGLTLARSCVSAADLRAAQSLKLALGKDDYLSVGYYVFNDEIQISTSRSEEEVRAALATAGVRSPVTVDVGNPGDLGRGVG